MAAEPWRPRTILRFIDSIPTSTNVVLVETDAGDGYLKAMGNPEGPHVLACELVGTLLAEWFELDTLEFALIDVGTEDEIPLANGGKAAPGPAFITKAEDGMAWGGDEATLWTILNREAISRLVVFDTWVRNCDRYRESPRRVNIDNVFLTWQTNPRGLVLKAIDHTHAFTCGRDLTTRIAHLEEIWDRNLFGCFPAFAPLLDAQAVGAAAQRLSTMNRVQAEEIVARVPEQWEVAPEIRRAWAEFLYRRAAFVSDNVVSWLF